MMVYVHTEAIVEKDGRSSRYFRINNHSNIQSFFEGIGHDVDVKFRHRLKNSHGTLHGTI